NPAGRNTSDLLFGGCDNDQSFDKNELVTYSVAVYNNDRFDEYTDLTATLTACSVPFTAGFCGTCSTAPNQPCNSHAVCDAGGACSNLSTAVTVLDSPKNIGRLPVGQPDAVTFSVLTGAGPFAPGAKVYLRLDLTATGAPKDLSRLNF